MVSETGNQQHGYRLGSLREVCERNQVRQRADARPGRGVKPAAVRVMISKFEGGQKATEGLTWKR